jgi:proteasome lid subunit RPN8/RPN11
MNTANTFDSKSLPRKPFPLVHYSFRVFVEEAILDRIDEESSKEHEVGGVLVGELLADDSGVYLHVDALVGAEHASETSTEVTFTHETWTHISHTMDTQHPGKQIVGWYHTHPGFGIFLSDQDKFIHRNFFSEPHQIALVYDPVTREHGVFRWRRDRLIRMRRYWIGQAEHIWDGPRESSKSGPTPAQRRNRESRSDAIRPENARSVITAPVEDPSQALRTVLLNAAPLAAIVIALAAGLLGFNLGRDNAAVSARAEGAMAAINSLNGDILAALDSTLQQQASSSVLTSANLIRDAADVSSSEQTRDQLLELHSQLLTNYRDMQSSSDLVRRLHESVSESERSMKSVVTSLHRARQARANLYLSVADLMSKSGDARGATGLVTAAIRNDPENAEIYTRYLKRYKQPASDQ